MIKCVHIKTKLLAQHVWGGVNGRGQAAGGPDISINGTT